MGLRNFPPSVEAVARDWRSAAVIDRGWKFVSDAPEGESNSFYVRSGELAGVAKPRATVPPPAAWPRAAIEKICSDLAYDLGLPVPPVALWAPTGKTGLPVEQLCVSLFPFGGVPHATWGDIEDDAQLVEALRPHFREPASAMVAFDSWVGNTDRRNPGNVLVQQEPESGAVRIAYIDFAGSLLFGWADDGACEIHRVDAYPDAAALDASFLSATVAAIEQLSKSAITDIVQRVPPEFLSAIQKARIIQVLIARQSTLRGTLTRFFAEIPWGASEISGRA